MPAVGDSKTLSPLEYRTACPSSARGAAGRIARSGMVRLARCPRCACRPGCRGQAIPQSSSWTSNLHLMGPVVTENHCLAERYDLAGILSEHVSGKRQSDHHVGSVGNLSLTQAAWRTSQSKIGWIGGISSS